MEIELLALLRSTYQDLIDQRTMRDRDTLVGQLVASAVEVVPAAFGAGISRVTGHDVRSSHATTSQVQELDQLQSRLLEGPCIEAADEPPADGLLLARDLCHEDAGRWPRFAPSAVRAGVRSMLSVSMLTPTRGTRSALNLYSDRPDAFDDDAVTTAGHFASHAGVLLHGADHAHHLTAALESRDVIGSAKGILMERFTLDRDEAFTMLVKSSQDTNMKLTGVAEWLVGETEAKRRRARTPERT